MRMTAEFMSFSKMWSQCVTPGETFLTDVAFIFQNAITLGKKEC